MDILTKFATPSVAGLPKYAQLREMLVAAINAGHWKPGDKLPTEAELARTMPYSLGTVQKALRDLVDEGMVTRSQGTGTFVTEPRRPIDAPLHLRFLGGEGEPKYLPLFPKVLGRKRVSQRGPWSEWLQHDNADIVRVDRRLSVNKEFNVFNRFYFDAATFPDIAEKPLKELDGANLKQLLGSRVNMPVTHVEQKIVAVRFAPEICKAAGWKAGTSGILLESAARAGRGTPIYFLESFIPPTARRMDVGAD